MTQSQSFTSIKADLLGAIQELGLENINGNALPSSPEDIIFGLPVDKNDISKGWVALEIPEVDEGSTKAKGVKKGSILNESPLGAALKNGDMLAFKFKDADAEEDDMVMDTEWDVIIPSFEDESGSQN